MKYFQTLVFSLSLTLTIGFFAGSTGHAEQTQSSRTVNTPSSASKTLSQPVSETPPGKRVPGSRTKKGPDADWVPFAALGVMVFFFVALFGFKALKSRNAKPVSGSERQPPSS
tara:strand:- start:619 stop:957 length:339 start_codon:yes stop_codon:yes gene_type:complete